MTVEFNLAYKYIISIQVLNMLENTLNSTYVRRWSDRRHLSQILSLLSQQTGYGDSTQTLRTVERRREEFPWLQQLSLSYGGHYCCFC